MTDKTKVELMNRRQVLGSLGLAAAGSALLNEQVLAVQNPAAEVTDRTSSIRITGLTPHIFRDRVYVKVETNHGIFGWGEIKGVIGQVSVKRGRLFC